MMGDGGGDGALGSDHINYLILRYLQEAGHQKAATALYEDWHRADEYHDPEKLPFARNVRQHALVSIIQDGLHYDEIQAHVRNDVPRFNLTSATLTHHHRHAQAPVRASSGSRDTKAQIAAGTAASGATTAASTGSASASAAAASSAQRRSSQTQRPEQDDFPMPPSKRARRTNGTANPNAAVATTDEHALQVNGDAMDIDGRMEDARSDDLAADTDRAVSEAERSVDYETGAKIETETSSEGTQTDKKPGSDTVYWKLDHRDASIMHAMWNPQPEMATRLLTFGESLCRFHDVPESPPSPPPSSSSSSSMPPNGALNRVIQHHQTSHVEVLDMPERSLTTAACWHPTGRYATCAVDIPRPVNGSSESIRRILDANLLGGTRFYDDAHSWILKGPTVTTALRYNASGSRLLAVSTNARRGMVEIWVKDAASSLIDPSAIKLFAQPVYDAVWLSDDSIAVCGQQTLDVYTVQHKHGEEGALANGDSFASTGARNLELKSHWATDASWDKICYDNVHRVIAATSQANDSTIMLTEDDDSQWNPLPGFPTMCPRATAMAFEPTYATDTDTFEPRRFATTHDSGDVRVFAVTQKSCEHLRDLSMTPHADAALALAWSPRGNLLAVASESVIKIWRLDAGHSTLILVWKASPSHWSEDDDDADAAMTNGEEESINEPTLSWDAVGKRLVFAAGRKMAVIHPRPLDIFQFANDR